MTQRRIALFGGTFDPVHSGHLLLAEAARLAYRLDRILFIPTGVPPHKLPAVASPRHRLKMLRLATQSSPFFSVSDWEVRQNRVVYSYETLTHIQKSFPHATLFFIVGSDMLKTVPHWKNGTQLLKTCTFLCAERPDIPWKKLPAALRQKARSFEWPSVPFASHDIRAQVRRRRSIRYQVPEAVERYIQKNRLYR